MGRVRQVIQAANEQGRAALVGYMTAGDPNGDDSLDVLLGICEGGCDVVEVGVPFSDPSADGPVIQEAMKRALANGGNLTSTLELIRKAREQGCTTPIVLFGYYNPLVVAGLEKIGVRCADSGVDAVLTVDVPLDELSELAGPLARSGVGVVPLVAPTSTPDRIARTATFQPEFAYYISVTGITGSDLARSKVGAERIAEVRGAVAAPVAVGFGIKTPEHVAHYAQFADAVVVGSALISAYADSPKPREAAQMFIASLVPGLKVS